VTTIASLLRDAETHACQQEWDQARTCLEQIIAHDSGHVVALEGLPQILSHQGHYVAAAEAFDRLIAVAPRSTARLRAAAASHRRVAQHGRAVTLFKEALSLAPRDLSLIVETANALGENAQVDEAITLLTQTIRMHPKVWQLHYNLGCQLGLQGQYDAEIEAYQRALQCAPDCLPAYVNLGVAFRDKHRFDDAMRMFKKAVQLKDDYPGARANRAQTNLLLGQYEHGWREYEWRWREGWRTHPYVDQRLWLGEAPLKGKTILLHAEQGFGDTVQFVRYVSLVHALGAHVILQAQPALLSLLREDPEMARMATILPLPSEGFGEDPAWSGAQDPTEIARAATPPFDYQTPLMSLPLAFKTTLQDMPSAGRYLQANPLRVQTIEDRLKRKLQQPLPLGAHQVDNAVQSGQCDQVAPLMRANRRLRVGIAWAGRAFPPRRSIPLAALRALIDMISAAGVDVIALQKDVTDTDRKSWETMPALLECDDAVSDFADTGALISTLDLVISIDTVIAHLAGALAKPTWVLLRHTPDWRWLLDRGDSPWYETMRLFRQPTPDDWATVLERAQTAMLDWLADAGQQTNLGR